MIVAEYSWEHDTFTHHAQAAQDTDTMAEHQQWLDAVATVHAKAVEALPAHTARLDLARLLVLDGAVVPQQDGSFLVQSQTLGDKRHYRVNGRCECPGYAKQAQGYCKHRLASMLYRRAHQLLVPEASSTPTSTPAPELDETTPQPEASIPTPTIRREYIVTIQDKPFVKFAGLLALAHERGLIALTAEWTFNDADLSLAHAVATFQDGRRFEESGDASPSNTSKRISPHFRRVALTRAKARALRDALGIDMVAVEELADSE